MAWGIPYPVSARTTGRSKLCRVPLAAFQAKARDNVHVEHFFGHLLRIELYNAARYIVNLKTATPADRLERFLQYFSSASGQASRARSEGVFIPLRDYQIAELMGLSVRHFERVKHQLQSERASPVERATSFSFDSFGPSVSILSPNIPESCSGTYRLWAYSFFPRLTTRCASSEEISRSEIDFSSPSLRSISLPRASRAFKAAGSCRAAKSIDSTA